MRGSRGRRPPCAISAADHTGWAHLVCVSTRRSVPEVVERRRVSLIDRGLPSQPYEHDTLALPEREAEVLVSRVDASASACAARALEHLIADLGRAYSIKVLAIRQPPFAEIPASVAAVHASARLRYAADGMLYQRALCRAAKRFGLDVRMCRRGEEVANAAALLDVGPNDIAAFVSRSGRPPGPPWTAEHRRAFAAGIAALAPYCRGRLSLDGARGAMV